MLRRLLDWFKGHSDKTLTPYELGSYLYHQRMGQGDMIAIAMTYCKEDRFAIMNGYYDNNKRRTVTYPLRLITLLPCLTF